MFTGKKILSAALLFVFTAFSPAFAEVAITSENFPDSNFREYISSDIDLNNDGYLSDSEIASVRIMDVSGKEIDTLAGIENFTALQELYCYTNNLISLDVSQISGLLLLECDNNYLTSLDVSKNLSLINLECESNKLAELDLSSNVNLSYVKCYTQTRLGEIELSSNDNFYRVNISRHVSDFGKITDITAYNASDDKIVSSFDVSAGIITINDYPARVEYGYNVGYLANSSLSMDVNIKFAVDSDTNDKDASSSGCSNGCNVSGNFFAIFVIILFFSKYREIHKFCAICYNFSYHKNA